MDKLKHDLRQAVDSSDEAFVSDIIADAVNKGDNARWTVSDICVALEEMDASSVMNPLVILPILTTMDPRISAPLAILVSKKCSPKELVLTIGECIERLRLTLIQLEEGKGDSEVTEVLSPLYVGIFIRMYGHALSRLKSIKRQPSEILETIVPELIAVIRDCGRLLSTGNGRSLISSVSELLANVKNWIREDRLRDEADVSAGMLRDLLLSTLESNQHDIKSSLAISVFKRLDHRLSRRMRIEESAERGNDVIRLAQDAMNGIGSDTSRRHDRIGELILHAHSCAQSSDCIDIEPWLPVILSCLSRNVAMDEAVSVLMMFTSSMKVAASLIPENISSPLLEMLVPIASMHPDADLRLIHFRLIASLLAASSVTFQVTTLLDLMEHTPFPQMRTSAVSLLRELTLQSLESQKPAFLSSPRLIHSFGSILFRSEPPDLLQQSSMSLLTPFLQSAEPARLTECLSFYFILLKRDPANRTGIHDIDVKTSIERNILAPLRQHLEFWSNNDTDSGIGLAPLSTAIERVDSVLTG